MALRHRLEEILVLIIILLNLLDFAKLLPGDIEFAKKILSWSVLGYLLYEISITKQIFGNRRVYVDITIIISYFMLVFQHIASFTEFSYDAVLTPLYVFLMRNAEMLSFWSFCAGCTMILILAVYLTFFLHVHQPSLIHVLHEEGIPKTFRKRIERFLIIFLILNFLFLFVFNLMMEWLAVAVDSSLIVLAIFLYILTAFRRHFRKFDPDSFIFKVGSSGEVFYAGFISLFHSKKRIYLGLAGILVLHLLVDIGNFVVPYVFGIEGFLYLPEFDKVHMPLFTLFAEDMLRHPGDSLILMAIYSLNVAALVLLLFLPSYMWYKVYHHAGFKIKSISLSIFFICMTVFLIAPIFTISGIASDSKVGIDVRTSSLADSDFYAALPIAFAVGLVVFLASKSHWIKERMLFLSCLGIVCFVGYYAYNYLSGSIKYYWGTIQVLVSHSSFLVPFFFFIFMCLTAFFYLAGFMAFLIENKRAFNYIK